MSSRRLLVLVQALPEDSTFARAVREGDWSTEQYLRAATVNELRSLRVDQASLQGQKMDMAFVESPSQVADREEDSEEKQQIRAQILMHLGVKEDGN
jgi:hypothetical protein